MAENIPLSTIRATSSPYTQSNARDETFEILDYIRVNNLGIGNGEAGIFSHIDKSQGFFDLNFKSFSVSGDLELIETPGNILLKLKQDVVTPTYIQSGVNATQTGGRIYKGVSGDSLEFRTVNVGPNLTLQMTNESVVIGLDFTPNVGDITGAANLGAQGLSLYKNKTLNTLNFKKLYSASAPIQLTTDSADNMVVIALDQTQLNLALMSGSLPANRVSGLSALATDPNWNNVTNKPFIPTKTTDLTDFATTVPATNQIARFVSGKWTPSAETVQNAFTKVSVGAASITAASSTSEFSLATDNGIEVSLSGTTIVHKLANSGVTPGAYTFSNVTVDRFGRVVSASNGVLPPADPMTTTGDIIYRETSASARLPIGTANQVLTTVAGKPKWMDIPVVASVKEISLKSTGGIVITGGPVTNVGEIGIGLQPSGITAGVFNSPSTLTIDTYGRITAATNSPSIAVPGVYRNANVEIDQYGKIVAIAPGYTSVVPGTYTIPTLTVNEYGAVTAIESVTQGIVASTRTIFGNNGLTGGGTLEENILIGMMEIHQEELTYNNPDVTVDVYGRVVSAVGHPDVNGTALNIDNVLRVDSTGFYFPTATSYIIGSSDNELNMINKVAGKAVFDTTTNLLMIATGPEAEDPWVWGTTIITPALLPPEPEDP